MKILISTLLLIGLISAPLSTGGQTLGIELESIFVAEETEKQDPLDELNFEKSDLEIGSDDLFLNNSHVQLLQNCHHLSHGPLLPYCLPEIRGLIRPPKTSRA